MKKKGFIAAVAAIVMATACMFCLAGCSDYKMSEAEWKDFFANAAEYNYVVLDYSDSDTGSISIKISNGKARAKMGEYDEDGYVFYTYLVYDGTYYYQSSDDEQYERIPAADWDDFTVKEMLQKFLKNDMDLPYLGANALSEKYSEFTYEDSAYYATIDGLEYMVWWTDDYHGWTIDNWEIGLNFRLLVADSYSDAGGIAGFVETIEIPTNWTDVEQGE